MRLLLWLALALAPALAGAAEGRVTHADLQEIRAVIHRQIDAFGRDDAPGVFSCASAIGRLQITDRAAGQWVAYFSMQRQSDGSWRTNGCHLVQPARTISA
jgi:hypothetical protein